LENEKKKKKKLYAKIKNDIKKIDEQLVQLEEEKKQKTETNNPEKNKLANLWMRQCLAHAQRLLITCVAGYVPMTQLIQRVCYSFLVIVTISLLMMLLMTHLRLTNSLSECCGN
jgi:K+-sensing histidine kinase KdpD